MWVKCTTGIKNSEVFSYKKVYEVKLIDSNIMLITADNGKDVEIEKCTHIGKKGGFSFYQPVGGFSWFAFEEVDEPKYATSPEVLAQVFRKMADNVENGLPVKEGIQLKINGVFLGVDNDSIYLDKLLEYRVKPETITLKNGVEIPKPLKHNQLTRGTLYHFPTLTKYLFDSCYKDWLIESGVDLVYATKEEAIGASKALFGLEIKDV